MGALELAQESEPVWEPVWEPAWGSVWEWVPESDQDREQDLGQERDRAADRPPRATHHLLGRLRSRQWFALRRPAQKI